MATNIFEIKSVDINNIPKEEIFAVDTNVLLWTHYSKASNVHLNVHPYQVTDYPNFIADLLNNGNKIITTFLNLSELCGVVERSEYKIYKVINGLGRNYGIKDFRKNSVARGDYKSELDNILLEISQAYAGSIEFVSVDQNLINEFAKNICNNNCDVFDYAVIEYLKSIGVKNYISDDRDYGTVDGINLYYSQG